MQACATAEVPEARYSLHPELRVYCHLNYTSVPMPPYWGMPPLRMRQAHPGDGPYLKLPAYLRADTLVSMPDPRQTLPSVFGARSAHVLAAPIQHHRITKGYIDTSPHLDTSDTWMTARLPFPHEYSFIGCLLATTQAKGDSPMIFYRRASHQLLGAAVLPAVLPLPQPTQSSLIFTSNAFGCVTAHQQQLGSMHLCNARSLHKIPRSVTGVSISKEITHRLHEDRTNANCHQTLDVPHHASPPPTPRDLKRAQQTAATPCNVRVSKGPSYLAFRRRYHYSY